MRDSFCRLLIVCLVLALFAGDLFACGRARGRRAQPVFAVYQTCTPSYGPAPQMSFPQAPGCSGGKCPLPK